MGYEAAYQTVLGMADGIKPMRLRPADNDALGTRDSTPETASAPIAAEAAA